MSLPNWPPKDWRQLLALLFLAGGGIAMTIVSWRVISLLELFKRPSELAWMGYGALLLIGVVLTGFATVLGRRSFKGQAGPVSFEAEGGDE